MKKFKLQDGTEITVKPLTWKQAKEIKLMTMISKYNVEDGVAVIDEDDMDKVLSVALPEDIVNKLTMEEAFELFGIIMELSMPEKK